MQLVPLFMATARVGRPPVAPSLLPWIIGDERPIFPGPVFSLRFELIIKKRSLREGDDVVLLLIVLSTRDRWIFLEAATTI